MKFPQFIAVLLVTLYLFILSCTSDPSSGLEVVDGGSGTDIVCLVYNSDYYEVEGAKVVIRPSDFRPGLDDTTQISTFTGKTNSKGEFIIDSIYIDSLTDSNFTISIINGDNTGSIRAVNFKNVRDFDYIDDSVKILRYFVLEPNGKASGHVVNGPENKLTNRALVFIPGTNFADTADSNGEYLLDSIPTGLQKLTFIDLDSTEKTIDIENVEIKKESETDLDTVSLNGIALLQLTNNFPNRLDTLYTLNTPSQYYYISMETETTITTPPLFNNFQFVNWELVYGKTKVVLDTANSSIFAVDSNSIVRANYKDIQGPDSIENINIDVKGNQVTFTWSPTTDNDTVKEYCIIYRYQSDSSIIDTFIYTDTVAYFEGLSFENTSYTCTLKAMDPSGNFSPPNILTFKTEKNDSTPPVFNSDITIQKLNSTYASIFWNPAVDGLGIKKYEVLVNDKYTEFRTECFYHGEDLTPGDTINVKVRAYDYYDNISTWIEKDIIMPLTNDTIAPTIPIIDSSWAQGQSIYFSWAPSIDNISDTVTYEIKYLPLDNSGSTPVFITLLNTNEYTLSGLKSTTTYEISIRAFDKAWYYSDFSTVQVTTE